ncbi:hypothetical protein BGW80DRAFT_1260985 [Lactifluus volemus]|nr:hypothetical protein BGW80DRAFT_1260985 [Lactifluus volemus]
MNYTSMGCTLELRSTFLVSGAACYMTLTIIPGLVRSQERHSYYFLMGYNRDVAPRTPRHRRHVGTVGTRFKFDPWGQMISLKQFALPYLGGILASVTSDRVSRDFDPVSSGWQCLKHGCSYPIMTYEGKGVAVFPYFAMTAFNIK